MSLRCACMTAMLAMPLLAAAAAPEHYTFSPATGRYSWATALNDEGRYGVNSAAPDIPYQVASIQGAQTVESLGNLGGSITRISGLNNLGEAVGMSTTATGATATFLYSAGRMDDLTARYGIVEASDINDRGEIAARTTDGRALVLRNGVVDDFGPPHSAPGDMNEGGELLVSYLSEGEGYRTAVYSRGKLTDLPRYGGRQLYGSAINDAGWITGHFMTADGRNHAFLYDGTTVTDLDPDAGNALGYDIDNAGEVVGVADDRAVLYADGGLIDLNTLIDPEADLLLKSADDSNSQGQVLAHSCDRSGVFCYGSVLLSPVPAVPEPSAAVLLSAGLALVAGRRRRIERQAIYEIAARRAARQI